MHHARFHARPPGGVEPQVAPALERSARDDDRLRTKRVDAASASAATGGAPGASRPDTPEARGKAAGGGLSLEERAVLSELAERDRKVRAHEAAHARVGGQYAGQPRYEFVTGPDGKRYAIAGQVQIDVSTAPSDPAATIEKMQVVKAAALAPADPSPADRRVAALAERLMRAAEADLRDMRAADRAGQAGDETERLARLALLFAQTVLLPAPDPSTIRAA